MCAHEGSALLSSSRSGSEGFRVRSFRLWLRVKNNHTLHPSLTFAWCSELLILEVLILEVLGSDIEFVHLTGCVLLIGFLAEGYRAAEGLVYSCKR